MVEDYGVENLNPRSQAVKSLETTVLRALQLIEAFDLLGEGEDWTDVPAATYRKIIGERYMHARMLEECYKRWQNGTLQTQTKDLFENLPPTAQQRKEIVDGFNRINPSRGGGGKKPTARSTSGKRSRQQRLF